MELTRSVLAGWIALMGIAVSSLSLGSENYITVASTTSTEQSGLFGHMLPRFEKASGIKVRVVAVGTGQALDIGRRGDADVVFVHDKAQEEKFVAAGFGVKRYDVMYNDFVLVGPISDTARIGRGRDIVEAFKKVLASRPAFVSRADKSGTHAAELRFWRMAGVDIEKAKGAWYRETGSGMGPALNTAASLNAYILSDRGTWLSFKNKSELAVLVEGDERLFNQYGVTLVNPRKHPHVKEELAQRFIDWIVSPLGQKAIADFRVEGQQLFYPNASVEHRAPSNLGKRFPRRED